MKKEISYEIESMQQFDCDWYYAGEAQTLKKARSVVATEQKYDKQDGVGDAKYRIVKVVTTREVVK